MELLLIGLAVAFNCIVILVKFRRHRYLDGILDMTLLVLLSLLFMGTYSGLVVATVASLAISIYLLIFPPKLPSSDFAKFLKDF